MNQSELVKEVAAKSGLARQAAEKAVAAIFDSLEGALKKGEDVRLVGFGSFSVGTRQARDGKNPRTGEPIKIAAAKVVKFSAGKGLRDAVND